MKVRFRQSAFLLVVLLCSVDMYRYWNRLPQFAHLATITINAKPLTDLYPRWYGTRELLLRNRDPYGIEVSREIQVAFYGKVLDSSQPGEPRDEQRFAYPLYVVLLLAPSVKLDFETVRIIFWWLLAGVTVFSAVSWLRFVRLQLSMSGLATMFLLFLSSVPVLQGLGILQLGLLVAFFLSLASLSVVSGHLFLAGSLLALATIKPQLSALPIGWFLLWVAGDWRQRRALFGGFAFSLAALILGSEYLLPGWLWRYPIALRAYAGYTGATSLVGILFSSTLSWPITVFAVFIAARYCWRARRQPAGSCSFAIALGFALTLTVTVVPTVIPPFNHVLLLPVVLLTALQWEVLWRGNTLARFATIIFCAFGFLPWLLALILAFVPASHDHLWMFWSAPLSATLALPFAALGLLVTLGRVLEAKGRINTPVS